MAKKTYTIEQLDTEDEKTRTNFIVKKIANHTKRDVKLRLRKYDPVLRRHCWFIEKRMPSHAKR